MIKAIILICLKLLFKILVVIAVCTKQEPEPIHKKQIVVISTGDIFIHQSILKSVKKEKGIYNFKESFELVEPYLSKADIATTWFEGTLDNIGPYTGYPKFKSPVELAAAMKGAGIDLVFASNHVMDYGEEGLVSTIGILDSIGILHAGAYLSQVEYEKILVVEKDGIKVAFLSYTYGTNDLPIPKSYMVSLIDTKKIKEDISNAKKMADFTVVALHFGKQYERKPTKKQKQLVKQVVNFGPDFIVGSHCHVIQPAALIKREGDNLEEAVFVAYCLGNFLCNQRKKHRDTGIMIRYVIEKNFDIDSTYLKEAKYIPIWIAKRWKKKRYEFKITPVQEAIAKWEKKEWLDVITKEDYKKLKEVLNDVKDHIDDPQIDFTLFKRNDMIKEE